MRKTTSGFTIVELLIVIVVIAILAAISIVAYNGIQNRTNDSAVKSDLSLSLRNVELYRVDNDKYPTGFANLAAMKTAGHALVASQSAYNTSTNNYAFCYDGTGNGYAIAARSKSGKVWYVSEKQSSPTEYPNAWGAAVATLCPVIVDNNTTGQWVYQGSVWSTSLL